MVVAYDAGRFDAGTNQKIDQYRFQFGLAGFEVIASDEYSRIFGKFNDSGHERVLGGAIYVGALEVFLC